MYQNYKIKFSMHSSSFTAECLNDNIANFSDATFANLSPIECLQLWKKKKHQLVLLNWAISRSLQQLKNHKKSKYGFLIADVYREELYPKLLWDWKKEIWFIGNSDQKFIAFIKSWISTLKSLAPSIRDINILDDSQKIAAEFSINKPFQCSCQQILHLGSNVGYACGHTLIKNKDICGRIKT